MKRYFNSALIYSILAMAGGVFYREFTKFNGFNGRTDLGFVHAHYFILGMVFFMLLALFEKNFSFTKEKTVKILTAYHAGLNLTALMFVVRGIMEVKNILPSSRTNAIISGLSGIGHILIGINLVIILLQIRKCIVNEA